MRPDCQLWAFNAEVTASHRIALSTMLLWLAHWAQNFLWDARGDCLWRRGVFLFCDFGLPRTGSSSAVYPGSLDSLYLSSGISSSSAWALGLIWNGSESLDPLALHYQLINCGKIYKSGFWKYTCNWTYIILMIKFALNDLGPRKKKKKNLRLRLGVHKGMKWNWMKWL